MTRLHEKEVLVGYTIHTLEELLQSGENFKLEDVSPDLMTLRIKIHGDQFDGSITGEVAKSLAMLQTALYRAAAEALHGTSSITALSAEEKAQLEIVIKVSPGCSDIKIPGLIQIKLRSYKRPKAMIHPYTGNIIPVCNKFSLTTSYNCGICSINTNTSIIINDHLSYLRWLHDQQGKAILP